MLSSQGSSPVQIPPQQGCMNPPQVRHSPSTQVAPGSHAVPQHGLPTAPQATHAPALQTPSCPQGVPFG